MSIASLCSLSTAAPLVRKNAGHSRIIDDLRQTAVVIVIAFVVASIIGVVTALPTVAAADSGCPTDSDPINTDRPNTTNSALTVPYGSLQVENGVTWTARDHSNVIDGSETIVRLGVARCTEFVLNVPTYFYSTDSRLSSGFSDVGVEVKREFPLPHDFTLAATAGLFFPTGAKKVSGPGYDPFLQFPWSKGIADGWSVSGMFTVIWFPSLSQRNPTFEPTIAIGRELGPRADALIEYVGDYDHQRPSQILDTGAVYRVTDHQQIDFQAGFGLNSSSLDHFFGLGYSFRFDRLF